MALPFTSYATIAGRVGLLARLAETLDEDRKAAAETYALRECRAWLKKHLEGTTLRGDPQGIDSSGSSPEYHAQLLLDELEAYWDGNASEEPADNGVDPLVQDLARTIAECRYLQELGHFDGKTGSSQFHAFKRAKEEIETIKLRVYAAGKLDLSSDGALYFRVRRFREL